MEKMRKPFVYVSKERKNRTVRIFHINRIIALILLLTIIASGIIAYIAIKINNNSKIDSRNYYFIQMGEFTSSGDALAKSLELKNSGACGYIINDGIFRVMATVFASKSDAEIVKSKLITAGKECKIYEVKTKKQKIGKYESEAESKIIRNLLVYPIGGFFLELQKQDITLDAGETTDSAVLLAVGNLKKEIDSDYEEIRSFLSKYPADKTLNAMEKIYRGIQISFSDYFPHGELIIGSSIKSMLCATVENYLSVF